MDDNRVSPMEERALTNTIERAATVASINTSLDRDMLLANQLKKANIDPKFAKAASQAFNKRLTVLTFQKTADEHKADSFPLTDADRVYRLVSERDEDPIMKAASWTMSIDSTVDEPVMQKAASAGKSIPGYEYRVSMDTFEQHLDSMMDKYAAAYRDLDFIKMKLENTIEAEAEEVANIFKQAHYDYDFTTAVNLYGDKLKAAIGDKLEAKNVVNQNANVDEHSFGGRMGEARNELMKDYALNYMVSEMARTNHLENMVYIHDLDSYAVGMHNCLTIPFDELLAKGFNTRQTDVRPANSINTAFQLVAVLFQLQSLQQFGGVSASHLDWTMVPYVRKSFFKHWRDGQKYIEGDEYADDLYFNPEMSIDDEYYKHYEKVYTYALEKTIREAEQAAEGMYHNLNTLQSRSGNQLPFTSINYGTCTLPEGRLIIKALLKGSIKGVGRLHKTPVFPCGIFQLMKGVNRVEGDPNYDLYQLALESTAKRLYPNYVNVDWSINAGYDKNDPKTYVSTMGCRTYNGLDINAEPGTNPQTKDGRGNIAPVTIIMPTLAMMAKEEFNKQFKGVDWTRLFTPEELSAVSSFKDKLEERDRGIRPGFPEDITFAEEQMIYNIIMNVSKTDVLKLLGIEEIKVDNRSEKDKKIDALESQVGELTALIKQLLDKKDE